MGLDEDNVKMAIIKGVLWNNKQDAWAVMVTVRQKWQKSKEG